MKHRLWVVWIRWADIQTGWELWGTYMTKSVAQREMSQLREDGQTVRVVPYEKAQKDGEG